MALGEAKTMKTWMIVMLVYTAPPNAVDWNGPWSKGMTIAGKEFFRTEAECRNEAIIAGPVSQIRRQHFCPTQQLPPFGRFGSEPMRSQYRATHL
jgi:hypothetical protein